MRMSVVGTVGLRPAQTLAQYLDRGSNDTHDRLISVQSIDPRTWIDRQTTRVSVVSGHVCCCVCLFQVVCVCILVVHVMFMSLCVSHMCYYLMSFFWMDTFVCVFWCIYMFLSVYLFISFSWGFLDLSVVQSDRLYMATYWDTNSVFNGQRVTCTFHWRALRCFRQNIATGVEVIWALWPMLCASKDKRMVSNSRNCVDVYLMLEFWAKHCWEKFTPKRACHSQHGCQLIWVFRDSLFLVFVQTCIQFIRNTVETQSCLQPTK